MFKYVNKIKKNYEYIQETKAVKSYPEFTKYPLQCFAKVELPDNLFNLLFVLKINLLPVLGPHQHGGITE